MHLLDTAYSTGQKRLYQGQGRDGDGTEPNGTKTIEIELSHPSQVFVVVGRYEYFKIDTIRDN